MRHVMLNMTDEISKKPGKCSISRSDAFEGMYKTCGAAIGADTWFNGGLIVENGGKWWKTIAMLVYYAG